MQIKQKEDVQWIEYTLLKEFTNLSHGSILRHGGSSPAPYDSMNLSYSSGDHKENVDKNLNIIQSIFKLDNIKTAQQCHSTEHHHLKEESTPIIQNCDAFLCNELHLSSLIQHADCQAALFYDPIQHAYANVHAGWRASIENIYAKTIQLMKDSFGSKVENLLVCLSPSLGPEHSEFIHYKTEFPEFFWDFQIKANFFNFWEISRQQLLQEGILNSHIECAQLCTYHNEKDFFSYRRDKLTGRNATFIMLR